ncbi:hypothetical protein JCM25156A_32010 [Komagataeibacter kakiaceti JCM 25156]|uniref:hypothetical protein n=1 Tax=Komagataeibacter kakiaceti TaxID=943261 RepID=UPI00047248C6|nr:hypothetical protein [Komagataeibacter kakiaceti]
MTHMTPLARLRHNTRSMRETAIRMKETRGSRALTEAELHDLGDWLMRQVIEIDGAIGTAALAGHLPHLGSVVVEGECREIGA